MFHTSKYIGAVILRHHYIEDVSANSLEYQHDPLIVVLSSAPPVNAEEASLLDCNPGSGRELRCKDVSRTQAGESAADTVVSVRAGDPKLLVS